VLFRSPVHINIPLREPFYPTANEVFDYSVPVPISSSSQGILTLSQEQKAKLVTSLQGFRKIAIIPGQQKPNPAIREVLTLLTNQSKAVVVADLISNTQTVDVVTHPDFVLQTVAEKSSLVPDLVISFGKSILSKPLKQFLRSYCLMHCHVQEGGYIPDPFQRLSRIIHCQPLYFLSMLAETSFASDPDFIDAWSQPESRVRAVLPEVMRAADFGEFKALSLCLDKVPPFTKIHLANSMAIRYASLLASLPSTVEIIANRGTSGIDGSSSTAVGCTFTTKETVTLITGDMAFFYDRNAFWHKYNLPNLRIIVLNNHAGGIFRLIEGPAQLPELEEFFETSQSLSAVNLADEFGFDYAGVQAEEELQASLKQFYDKSFRPKLLEIFSESKANATVLKNVKQLLKERTTSSTERNG
jgi:2-succinyl-5-enolpyruvyl-6-hydroxy-3-cyclohexene-1-carboxylate synthase